MSVPLSQILDLVGKLDDTPGDDTPRERFRRYLTERVDTVSVARDYIEECLRASGPQYNRALQDLANYVGHFLEFDVEFGRYQGVKGQIGYDGHWISPTGFHIVVEVKTTEVYSIDTAILVNYVDQLITAKLVPSWNDAIGLYVVGRPDPHLNQLQNAIKAEQRTNQLRIISVDSLLTLAEMMKEYEVNHDDALDILRPSGPRIDAYVNLLARLAAGTTGVADISSTVEEKGDATQSVLSSEETTYWLTPVRSDEIETAEQVIQSLVGNEHIYAFGDRTPGRKHMKPGDWICFCATTTGIVAHAQITSSPDKRTHPKVRHAEQYPWLVRLGSTNTYLDNPVVIDAGLRAELDAFEGRDPNTSYWSWFVQATRQVSQHDFQVLTRTG